MTSFFASLLAAYHPLLALYAALAIFAITMIGKWLAMMVPTLKAAHQINEDTYKQKMEKPNYAANGVWNRNWGMLVFATVFIVILPFCLTLEPQPWWRIPRDTFIILMFYDFFYYMTHRFLFHDSNFMAGPLKWMHAVHHRQLNPCKKDAAFLHPLETAIGVGLYAGSIFILSRFMGNFHLATVVVSWVAFSQINLLNHYLWTNESFPFKSMNYAAKMHHYHHARFTGGNFATITVLYDWMFGTLDNGKGYKNEVKPARQKPIG